MTFAPCAGIAGSLGRNTKEREMHPRDAIEKVRRTKYPCAIAIADKYGSAVEVDRLTPRRQNWLENKLERDEDYARRFVGVYDADVVYPEFMDDLAFIVSCRIREEGPLTAI